MSTTVRISDQARDKLRDLADRSGTSMQAVLEDAIERYRRARFFADLDEAYTELRGDPAAWAEELAERAVLEGTLDDGLSER